MADANERTFIMIKPDGVQRGIVGDIIRRFEQRGYKLVGLKMMQVGGKDDCIWSYTGFVLRFRHQKLYSKATTKNTRVREKHHSRVPLSSPLFVVSRQEILRTPLVVHRQWTRYRHGKSIRAIEMSHFHSLSVGLGRYECDQRRPQDARRH